MNSGSPCTAYEEAVREGLATLADIQRKADATGDSGTANSNEILDQGAPALAFFDNFSPVYQAVGARFGRTLSGDTSAGFVRDRYDEQRDLAFTHFSAEADALTKTADEHRDQTSVVAGRSAGLRDCWTGSAADASRQHADRLNQAASRVGDNLAGTAQIIRYATHTVSRILCAKASNVLSSVSAPDSIGGMTPDRVQDMVDVANGDQDADKLNRACDYFGIDISGSPKTVVTHASRWVSSVFRPQFEARFQAVVKICDDTRAAVDAAWKVLTDHLARVDENPFANQAVATASQAQVSVGSSQAGGSPPTGGGPAPTAPQSAGFSVPVGEADAATPGAFLRASGRLPASVDHSEQPGGPDGATGLGIMHDLGVASPDGATGLQSLNDHDAAQQQPTAQDGAMVTSLSMGGMGLGGMGIGGMGAGAAGGRDRANAGPWRTQGKLFDDDAEPSDVRLRPVPGGEQRE